MAEAPISAPANRSESFRIISRPSRNTVRPPGGRVNGFTILAELDIELPRGFRILCRRGACHPCFTHRANRLARENGLARRDCQSVHPRQNDMIAAAGIEDQELSI